jgi:hypothetical protein
MNLTRKLIAYLIPAIMLCAGLIAGCNNTGPMPASPPEQPVEIPSTTQNNTPTQTEQPQVTETGVDKVEVVYFHSPQRCKKCICFEERVTYVINTYFSEELKSGLITFKVIDLSDKLEAPTIRKYNAIASQLFINTIIEGTDHIRNVEEIWSWGCTTDPEGFDEAVRYFLTLSLKGELE